MTAITRTPKVGAKTTRTKSVEPRNGAQANRAVESDRTTDGDLRHPSHANAAREGIARVELTRLGLFVVDDAGKPIGAPFLAATLDVHGGAVTGFDVTLDLMGNGPQGKWPLDGVPTRFIVDNGIAFHSRAFRDVANALGIDIVYRPPASRRRRPKW